MIIMMYGGSPQLHAQTIFELDRTETAVVREMYDFMENVRPTLLNARQIHHAALIIDWTDYAPTEHFKGFYKALMEKHVPFEVVSRNRLKADILKEYKTVLIPNITHMSDEEIEEIRKYNAAGGGLVFTYQTGYYRKDGSIRKDNPLMDLAGVKGPFGIETFPAGPVDQIKSPDPTKGMPGAGTSWNHHFIHSYYRVLKEHFIGKGTINRLLTFRGSYTEVEPAKGNVIAEVVDYDYSMHHKHHPVMGWYPGHAISPLIVVNEDKKRGRVVYFTSEFDKTSYLDGLPSVMNSLTEAAIWTAVAPPEVQVDAPPTAETAIHYSSDLNTYTIMLINKTTNELHYEMLVRYVMPITGITITVRNIGKGIKNIRSIKGNEVEWDVSGDICHVRLLNLNEYDAVIIELKD
ncbi:MAG: beta-galactosidase trimerization domain-containing protein [Saccharofermentanales bacterium]